MDTAKSASIEMAKTNSKSVAASGGQPPTPAENTEFCGTTMPPLSEAEIVASTSDSKKAAEKQTPSERLQRR